MKIKRIFWWLLTSLQTVLGAVAVTIYYLSTEKMGVMRSLTYRNEIYNNFLLDSKIKKFLFMILLLSIIKAFKAYRESSNKFKYSLINIVLSIIVIMFSIKFDTSSILAYYVLLVCAVAILVLELFK